ncbi:MAG: 3-methyl-2-oxobutanoate hydroxymethyltransferase [Deltaproteobacteria bacterium]|nr:3-methyl-2-oxobutanoate hydroxymethyltransferase [Deltaproteobacteria bacterium]
MTTLSNAAAAARGLYAVDAGPARLRIHHLAELKNKRQRITAVTCYDATFARLVDQAGIDVVLVGDSLGNVIQGQETTLPVTVDHIVYHCAAVSRGLQRAHLVADLPFLSYRNADVALQSAGRMLAEGNAHAVKLEGGAEVAPIVAALVAAGIPVMGHIGLTPQSVHAMGGHRVQGRGKEARKRLIDSAIALQEAGCYSLVLEAIPADLAAEVSAALDIPTIGIGAGAGCDGQILVLYDLLGLNPGFKPKFVKQFAQVGQAVVDALGAYRAEVQAGTFPAAEHTYCDPTPVAAPEPRRAAG